MASPTQPLPIQPQPQRQRQRRSIAGPVVMILLGIVLLLTTMRVLQPQPLVHWFGTYWPALIILWGVIKLVEYQQAQREGTRPAGIEVPAAEMKIDPRTAAPIAPPRPRKKLVVHSCRADRVCARSEMGLETPEVLEVLARPQKHERGVDRRLVAAARSLAQARE